MASSQYLNYIVAPNPTVALQAVSVLSADFNVNLPANIANNTIDLNIGTLLASYYPTVGKTYQITMNFFLDNTFDNPPDGWVSIGLNYWTGSIYFPRADTSGFTNTGVSSSDLFGSVTLVFTHTGSTNVVRLLLTNSSGRVITSGTVGIRDLSIIDLGFGATAITGSPIS